MFKKVSVFFVLFFISFFSFVNISFAEDSVLSQDNILMKAFQERKKKLFDVINGGELSTSIKKLKTEIKSLKSSEDLNQEIKDKFLSDLKNIETTIENNKKKLNKKDLEKFLKESQDAIELKNNLIKKLNNEIEDNKINKEKNEILLKKLSKEQEKAEASIKKEDNRKYYIFFFSTLLLLLLHILLFLLLKYGKIKKEKGAYIKFFLIFGYTLFLIWFFFYLYPELLIFLIFISGYLLAINAHLIASFVGSIIILEKYKIGNIIKFGDFKGQIIRITTINTVLLPMTNEGMFSNKPIVIPNFKLLKEEVVIDEAPEKFIHNYILKFSLDLELDIIKLVENIEQNILTKHLHFRLNTLNGNEESFRTAMGFDRFGRIEVTFTWKGEDVLNKRIERKIMGLFARTVELRKKEIEEENENKKEEERLREEKRGEDKKEKKKKIKKYRTGP